MTDPLGAFRKQNTDQPAAQNNSTSQDDIQRGVDYVKSHGGDPKQAAIDLCKKYNIPVTGNPFAMGFELLRRYRNGG